MHIEYQCSNENVWEESGGTLQTITGLTSHETRVGGVQQVTGLWKSHEFPNETELRSGPLPGEGSRGSWGVTVTAYRNINVVNENVYPGSESAVSAGSHHIVHLLKTRVHVRGPISGRVYARST